MTGPIIITFIVFFAVILICISAYYFWERNQTKKIQSDRLEKIIHPVQKEATENAQVTDHGAMRKDKRLSSIPWLNEFLNSQFKSQVKNLVFLIEQTGLSIKLGEFLLITLLIGFIGATVINIYFHLPFAGFIVSVIPFWWLNNLREKRIALFIEQMPPALDLLNSDLKAGIDVLAGIKHISEEFSPPISEEFGKLLTEVNLGMPISDALNNLSERIDTMDVQMLCTGITINREMGGNLSELIAKVSVTVRERFRLRGIVKALTAEGKMSAWLLLALPFVMFGILNALAPETYNPFLTDPLGQKIIGGCLVSMAIGYFVIQKITQLEV